MIRAILTAPYFSIQRIKPRFTNLTLIQRIEALPIRTTYFRITGGLERVIVTLKCILRVFQNLVESVLLILIDPYT